MAELFGKAKSTINEHIKNIFAEGELQEGTAMKKFGISEFQQNWLLEQDIKQLKVPAGTLDNSRKQQT